MHCEARVYAPYSEHYPPNTCRIATAAELAPSVLAGEATTSSISGALEDRIVEMTPELRRERLRGLPERARVIEHDLGIEGSRRYRADDRLKPVRQPICRGSGMKWAVARMRARWRQKGKRGARDAPPMRRPRNGSFEQARGCEIRRFPDTRVENWPDLRPALDGPARLQPRSAMRRV